MVVRWHKVALQAPERRRYAEDEFRAVLVAGDAIALSGLVVGGPVLICSHTAFLAPGEGWVDRAGLMEKSWEAQVPEFSGDFFDPPARLDGELSAALVLNSTSTSTGCRVLVSHVRPVMPGSTTAPGPTRRRPSAWTSHRRLWLGDPMLAITAWVG